MEGNSEAIGENRLNQLKSGVESFTRRVTGEVQSEITRGAPNIKTSVAEQQSLHALNKVLRVLDTSCSMEEVKDEILILGLVDSVRVFVGQICPELRITKEDLRDSHKDMTKKAIELCGNRMGGKEFFRKFVEGEASAFTKETIFEDSPKLIALKNRVTETFGREYGTFVHLLYAFLHTNVRLLENIVYDQIRIYEEFEQGNSHTDESETFHFFEHLKDFLGFYGDVTQHLIDHCGPRQKKEIREESIRALIKIFEGSRSQGAVNKPGEKGNLYDVLAETLGEIKDGKNHWFRGDLKYSPFDVQKIKTLITPGISRDEIMPILLLLNNFHDSTSTALFQDLVQKVVKKGEREIYLPDVLIRLIHPKTIVKNPKVQQRFFQFLSQLKEGEIPQNDLALARSLEVVLHSDDPFLEIPLGVEDEEFALPSIRDLLMEVALDNFSETALRNGFDEEGNVREEGGNPLIPMVDALGLDPARNFPGNFKTAEVGITRQNLLRSGKAMLDELGFPAVLRFARQEMSTYLGAKGYSIDFFASGTSAFQNFMNECFPNLRQRDFFIVGDQEHDSVIKFLTERGKGGGIRVVPLNNPIERRAKSYEELARDIGQKSHPKYARGVIFSEQTRLGDAPCSDPRKKQANQLSMLAKYHKQKKLQNLRKKRRRHGHKGQNHHLDLPVIIDASQAIGRGEIASLGENRGVDAAAWFASGSKALGVGGVGVLALSKNFLASLPGNRQFHYAYEDSYLQAENIAALGLAVRRLRSNLDYFCIDGNFGNNKSLSLAEKQGRHMANLTKLAIESTERRKGRVLRPIHRNRKDFNGIFTVDFPDIPAIELLKKLNKRKAEGTLCFVEGREAVRFSCRYSDDEEANLEKLFDTIDEIRNSEESI